MRDQVDKVIKRMQDFPTLPVVYRRINELLRNPYTSASDISAVVSEDQVITTKLLRLVNSAHYGFPKKIETVTRAVSLVGSKALSDLVLATSVMDLFQDESVDNWSLTDFWRHSLGVACAARAIARRTAHPESEIFFVSGLIHDIGKIVWLQYFPEELSSTIDYSAEKKIPLYRAESERLKINHARIGRMVAKHWSLPERLSEAVAYHHEPLRSERHADFVSVIHVADCLANGLRLGFSGNGVVPAILPEAWELTGLKKEDIEPLLIHIDQDYEESMLLLSFQDENEKKDVKDSLSRV